MEWLQSDIITHLYHTLYKDQYLQTNTALDQIEIANAEADQVTCHSLTKYINQVW